MQTLETLRRKARETRTSDSEEDVEERKKKLRKNSTTEGESGSEEDAKSLSPEKSKGRAEAQRKKITLVKAKNTLMPRPHQVPSISQVTRRNQEKQEKEKKRRKLNSKRSRASNQYQQ